MKHRVFGQFGLQSFSQDYTDVLHRLHCRGHGIDVLDDILAIDCFDWKEMIRGDAVNFWACGVVAWVWKVANWFCRYVLFDDVLFDCIYMHGNLVLL